LKCNLAAIGAVLQGSFIPCEAHNMTDLHRTFSGDSILQSPMTEPELADRWQKSVRTLQRWRRDGYGPAYLRIGGTIHYRVQDILAFEAATCVGGMGTK
jgi:hypothetical protein